MQLVGVLGVSGGEPVGNGWGRDGYDQVSGVPTDSGYTEVSAGQYHACAIDSSGAIECWGDDTYDQVSDAP